ncbi:uncharacterized protein ANIA_10705 [Aspergillus nidulans FGSC A4]|uniref:Uncharacterized protein n=1 Tax=Emericella nidulans (strain FGSC A4 / ATCC 38163 / CBS 112.46 / NRRL 194 / M139) TaxID=227321 RepID=C8VFG7_EMENI|nr:hypothetical protein [Aspergillus nidulans FGSC A4]CBF81239.1 TPA: conserved hypothetical protein [Aspergillus nidulans FGSC A4]
MPHWGRPPGAHLGRQNGRRGGQLVDGAMRVEEPSGEAESQFGLRSNRLDTRQLAGLRGRGDILRSSVLEHDDRQGSFDGADYDMYEDTNKTVAYAVQLAMEDNEDWLVERALERIRRAHSEGHKNVTLSNRELEALERRRLQAAPDPAESQQVKGSGSDIGATPASPYPLDTSIYDTWARTSTSVSPQSSTTTLRSTHQPAYLSSASRPSVFHAPPAIPGSLPDDYQQMPLHQTAQLSESRHNLHHPIDTQCGSLTRLAKTPYTSARSHALHGSPDLGALAARFVTNRDSESDESSPRKRSPASSGDDIPVMEVIKHKVPSSPTRVINRGIRQRVSRP